MISKVSLTINCGTGDIHQAMVKEAVLGIDAADCAFSKPFLERYWQQYLDRYQEHDSVRPPVIYEMMQRIAHHPELPDLIEQELRDVLGPVVNHLALQRSFYGENVRIMHTGLLHALQDAFPLSDLNERIFCFGQA